MNIGLLIYINKEKSLKENIINAIKSYKRRFNKIPNVCYININQLINNIDNSINILIKEDTQILKNHLWIGIENKDKYLPEETKNNVINNSTSI